MKTLLLPIVVFAMLALPGIANAEQCRQEGTGKYAKCGTAGAVPASQYVAKAKTTKMKATAKPSMMSKMMMAKPTTAAAPPAPMISAKPMIAKPMMAKPMASSAPMMAKPKTVRCKLNGKFAKCTTPGAVPMT